MPHIVAVKFSQEQMPKHFDPNGVQDLRPEEFVLAEREGDQDIGFVAGIEWVSTDQLKLRQERRRRVIRRATDAEKDEYFLRRAEEKKALQLCKQKAVELKLPMKITSARLSPADGRMVFHFTSDQRVDFRQLVRELSMILHRRIELWQIGVRDEAKEVDGFGVCGLRTCCSAWLTEFHPITIKMAKQQDMNLPPTKLSGQCGRLLCCLSYEVDQYKDMAKDLLPKGATLTVDGKEGVIIDRNVLLQTYAVQVRDGGIVTVTAGQVSDLRVPDQMKRMAAVLRDQTEEPPGTSESGEEGVGTVPSTTRTPEGEREGPSRGRGEDEGAGQADGKRRRHRRRSRRGRGSGESPKEASPQGRDDRPSPQKEGGEGQKGDERRRGRRSGRGGSRSRKGQPGGGTGQDAKPSSQPSSEKRSGAGDSDGSGGGGGGSRRRRRRRSRGKSDS